MYKHGGKGTPEYTIWKGMRQRCLDKGHRNYRRYGKRGITICARWTDFEKFLEDMGPRPSSSHSIDRIDNSLGYSPENCRWATFAEQANNRRSSRIIEYAGKQQTLCQWARELGMLPTTLCLRLRKWGSVEKALGLPLRKNRPHPKRKADPAQYDRSI